MPKGTNAAAPPLSFFAGPKKPGKKPTKWLNLDDVAEILHVPSDWLANCLTIAPGALPGASWDGVELSIKETDLWRALGVSADLPAVCSVEEAARYLGKSPKTVYAWLDKRGDKGEQLLKHWKHAGVVRIAVISVLTVPAKLPSWAAPSFFSGRAET